MKLNNYYYIVFCTYIRRTRPIQKMHNYFVVLLLLSRCVYPFNYLFFCFATCMPPMISMIIPITARIIRTKNGLNENTVSPCQCNPNNLSFSPTIANNGLRNKLSANNTIPQIILLFIDSKPLFQLR